MTIVSKCKLADCINALVTKLPQIELSDIQKVYWLKIFLFYSTIQDRTFPSLNTDLIKHKMLRIIKFEKLANYEIFRVFLLSQLDEHDTYHYLL